MDLLRVVEGEVGHVELEYQDQGIFVKEEEESDQALRPKYFEAKWKHKKKNKKKLSI